MIVDGPAPLPNWAPLPPGVLAIVLAAGLGTRYRGPTHKLLAPFRGRRVIDHSVAAPLVAGFAHVVVVVGDIDLGLADDERLSVIRNPRPADGQVTSLRLGIARAAELGATTVVVGLGDAPLVDAQLWRRVAAGPGPLAIAEHDGVTGPPTRIDERFWSLLPTEGDEGARSLLRGRPELVTRVPCTSLSPDIDTEEDLARWS